MKHILLIVLLFSIRSWGIQVPQLTGPVIDQAGVLSTATRQQLSQVLQGFNQQGKAQIQILTLKSLQGESIEQASIQIVDAWKLGDAKKDNGILFLIIPNERKMRIEVGQGLEGDIPDAIASRILNDVVKPFFRSGDYSAGVEAGIYYILKQVDPNYDSGIQTESVTTTRKSKKQELSTFIILIIALIIISKLGGGGRGRRRAFLGGYALGGLGGGGWGSGGGGGWSGGGGGFSGGGSSSNW